MDVSEAVAFVVGISISTERLLETLSWSGNVFGNMMMNQKMIPEDEEKDVNNWKGIKQMKMLLSIILGPLVGWGEYFLGFWKKNSSNFLLFLLYRLGMAYWSGYPSFIGVLGGFLSPWTHQFLQMSMEAKDMMKGVNLERKQEKTMKYGTDEDSEASEVPRETRKNYQFPSEVKRRRVVGRKGGQSPPSPRSRSDSPQSVSYSSIISTGSDFLRAQSPPRLYQTNGLTGETN
jgi:hypothetical protein